MPTRSPRLLFLVNEDWYFWSHRLNIARAARDRGYEVVIATRVSSLADHIRAEGFTLLPMNFSRGMRNLFSELRTLREVIRLYRQQKPDIVHQVTIKYVLMGTLAARLTCVPAVVNALGGLGIVFTSAGFKAKLMRFVLRTMLRAILSGNNMRVILQNQEDYDQLIDSGVVREDQTVLIRGAGVDIADFKPRATDGEPCRIVLASRMLWSKGIGQFVECAQLLKSRGINAEFLVVGRVDEENPDHISRDQLLSWQQQGMIEWLGNRDDMPEILSKASIVCLPTYYGEGLPKVLLEAAACAKPIVTTDIPGCREICRDDVNGVLIPPKDVNALAAAITRLIENPSLRARMGNAGRQIVQQEFTSEQVCEQTLELYRELGDAVGNDDVLQPAARRQAA